MASRKTKPKPISRRDGNDRESRLTRLRALYTISDILTTTQRSDQVLKAILKEAVKVTRATSGSLILIDRANSVLNIEISANLDPQAAKQLKLKIGEGVTGWVAKTGKPLLVGDIRRSRHYVNLKSEVKCELAVPLIIGGEVVGVINVDSNRLNAFTKGDKELLIAVAAQSAKVMQAAQLYEENRRKAERLETLFNLAGTVVSQPLLDDVLRRVADEVRRLMDARVCSIMLLDEKGEDLEIKAVAGEVSQGYIDRKRVPVSGNVIGRVIESREPLYIRNVQEEKDFRLAAIARESGLCSLLTIPMIFLERPIGVVNIYTKTEHNFSEEDVALVKAFAGHAAVAIINAQRLERILRSEELLRDSEKFQLLGTLSAEIAHEIRNPLTIISMLVHSLSEDKAIVGESRRDLHVMEMKLKHMNRIVDQVLDFARSRVDQRVQVDLNSILDDVRILIGYKAASMGRKVEVRPREDVPCVQGDPGQLEQALLNLALNGLQSMQNTGETIHLSTAKVHRSGKDWAVLRVRDEGCGIPEEKLQKVFMPYFSMKDRGTGLGLFITRRIIEQHGGKLKVASRLGEGTTFEMILPAAEPTPTPPNGARVLENVA